MVTHHQIPGKGAVRSLSCAIVAASLCFGAAAQEQPLPADTAPIIMSAASQDPELVQLRKAQAYLKSRPDDLRMTVLTAQRFIAKGKRENQPRFLGMAEALIENWLSKYETHPAILLAKADILQFRHQFSQAITILEGIANAGVEGAAALLMRANLHQLKGDYDQAEGACSQLARELKFMADICEFHLQSLQGEVEPMQLKLEALIARLELPGEIRAWATGKLADMSSRRGQPLEALEYLEGLAPEQASAALKSQMMDLLLLLERPSAVLQMIAADDNSEGLQLRRLRALKMTGENWRGPISYLVLSRISPKVAGDANPHARELAYFHHYLTNDVEAAYLAARENWDLQREPIDIRLLFETAHRAGKLEDVADAIEWISQNKYQDVYLASFLQTQNSEQ